jgi:hypothetical protein
MNENFGQVYTLFNQIEQTTSENILKYNNSSRSNSKGKNEENVVFSRPSKIYTTQSGYWMSNVN